MGTVIAAGMQMSKQAAKKTAKPANAISIKRLPDESEARAVAHAAMRPALTAALTIARINREPFPDLSLNDLVDELSSQCKELSAGNLGRAEALLTTQAHTLDAIFNHLARRAILNMAEYMNATDVYLRLALKAQSQCRSTIEALAEIKSPSSVAFVKQANIAHGPQQVNNGLLSLTRAEETQFLPDKLLEKKDGERVDCGTAE